MQRGVSAGKKKSNPVATIPALRYCTASGFAEGAPARRCCGKIYWHQAW
ncbi:hypothetical protein Q460_07210 [Escherichia coli ATCC BAA-2219]|nr:hypothetical protein Q460_07210 [Escherichia coli ATCC BAA-2219]